MRVFYKTYQVCSWVMVALKVLSTATKIWRWSIEMNRDYLSQSVQIFWQYLGGLTLDLGFIIILLVVFYRTKKYFKPNSSFVSNDEILDSQLETRKSSLKYKIGVSDVVLCLLSIISIGQTINGALSFIELIQEFGLEMNVLGISVISFLLNFLVLSVLVIFSAFLIIKRPRPDFSW